MGIGLITALDKFEPEKGYHFISYAVWWIRQSIMKAISEKSRAVRLPLNRSNELIQIQKAQKSLMHEMEKTAPTAVRSIGPMSLFRSRRHRRALCMRWRRQLLQLRRLQI